MTRLTPMQMPFAHLHVASAFSMKYSAASIDDLVAAAATHEHSHLALTDRDSVAGAVRFVRACEAAGITPVLGVDFAVQAVTLAPPEDPNSVPTPVKGGRVRHWVRPRVLILGSGTRGWAGLCRLVSKAHANGASASSSSSPSPPFITLEDVAHCIGARSLVVLHGPASEIGHHIARRRPDLAADVYRLWAQALPTGQQGIEVISHDQPVQRSVQLGEPDLSLPVAQRMLSFAREQSLPAVVAHGVRFVRSGGHAVVDVLESVQALAPLTSPYVRRCPSTAGYASTAQMVAMATRICEGVDGDTRRLLRDTTNLALLCATSSAHMQLGTPHVPEILGAGDDAQRTLQQRCESALRAYLADYRPQTFGHGIDRPGPQQVRDRLHDELRTIGGLGFAGYFLTVAEVADLVRQRDIRVSARGSGAGSLVNHLLGISAVDPVRYGLLMERFLSSLRTDLPDIDIDVESARRLEVYDLIINRFGAERTACVSMVDTYRVRHAIRDVGMALGVSAAEVGIIAQSFPHIGAKHVRDALRDLPELRESGIASLAARGELDTFLDLVEGLDGLPRNRAMHPCGVILSDLTLLDRTPVQSSAQGYAMSQFDKDDVEELGFLKLDVLGVRMQSSIAHTLSELERVSGQHIALASIPRDDPGTFALIQSTRTLGCFQIESPGQRELVGKFAPATFDDIIIDISLFRPGPVKSDMITPFLHARQGWGMPDYIHESLKPILRETYGVVVFHEQVIRIIATVSGCGLDFADEVRRNLGTVEGQEQTRQWFYGKARQRGYTLEVTERVWAVLRAFASFGFCKAHAAAFAVPTYESAWLKAHHPAAFFAGVLTHDPGMYPKRLILDDARNFAVPIFPPDVQISDHMHRLEAAADSSLGIRLSLAEIEGVTRADIDRIVANRPYSGVVDVLLRASVPLPIMESLIKVGACDRLHGIGEADAQVTRRDLLLEVSLQARHRGRSTVKRVRVDKAAAAVGGVMDIDSAEQSDLFIDSPSATSRLSSDTSPSAQVSSHGLREMTARERMQAELSVMRLDVSSHIMSFHAEFLRDLRATRSSHLRRCRSMQDVLVAGVKVAIQTPPVRSGRRVVFLTLDDGAGPSDLTFFEDAQEQFASTLFSSWLMMVRGHVRRTGPAGMSIRAVGCWDLLAMEQLWREHGRDAVRDVIASGRPWGIEGDSDNPSSGGGADALVVEEQQALSGAAASRSTTPVVVPVLVHPSGFRQSPYADVRPAGAPAQMWHRSPGVSGR